MKRLFIMALAVFLMAGCSTGKEPLQEKEIFPVIHPLVADTSYAQEYVADIHSLQNVEVRARVKGFLEAIHADEGKFVKEGQLLFTFSNRAFREELAKARALLKSAQAEAKAAELELRNAKILAEKNVIALPEVELTESKLEAALAHVEEARANASSAELNLSYAEIRAPFDGTINRIPNKTGSLVDEGTLLTTISNNKDILAYFYVSEREYLEFRAQNAGLETSEVSLLLANNELYPHTGRIETVEGEIDKTTGNIAFRARFPNPGDLLKHGSNAKVLLKKELKAAMLVPQRSTFEVQDKTYLFIVDKNNTVHLQPIVPQFRFADFYVIAPVLKADDRIIYEGTQHVKNGDQVNVKLVSINNLQTSRQP